MGIMPDTGRSKQLLSAMPKRINPVLFFPDFPDSKYKQGYTKKQNANNFPAEK